MSRIKVLVLIPPQQTCYILDKTKIRQGLKIVGMGRLSCEKSGGDGTYCQATWSCLSEAADGDWQEQQDRLWLSV